MKTVITFGTYDVFHVGHLNILKRAYHLGDRLVVGVSTDKMNLSKKNKLPVYSQEERIEIVESIKYVDQVFLEESLDLKGEYIKKYSADILVMGDDWKGRFDEFNEICDVMYLPRTPSISTTEIIEKVRKV